MRLGLEGLDAAVVVGHVRTVHRAQRHAHRSRNRRLGHPTLTQQHHLDALALRRWYLPTKRSSQPPHLGFAAFGHLFAPNQMAQANHSSAGGNNKQFPSVSLKNTDSNRYGGGIRSQMIAFERNLKGIEACLKPSEPREQQPESKSRPWFAAAASATARAISNLVAVGGATRASL